MQDEVAAIAEAVPAPWHVRLTISSSATGVIGSWINSECAGVVRNASYIVSAAHCFIDRSTRRLRDRLSVTVRVPRRKCDPQCGHSSYNETHVLVWASLVIQYEIIYATLKLKFKYIVYCICLMAL